MSLARNVAWMLAGRWVYNLVSLVSFTIIGSIITPSDFGVFTLASTFLILADAFYADAVENLIVRHEGDEAQIAPTLFWVSFGFSLALAATIGAVAWPFGWAYGDPRVSEATAAIAAIIVFQGSAAVPRALLMRCNRSRQYAINSAISNMIGACIGIAAALHGAGFWSLILQQGCLQLTMLMSCSIAARFWPRMVFDRAPARVFAGNVGTMLWSTLLNVAGNRLDVLVVGALYGSTVTGFFGLARRLVQIIQDLVASSFDKILLSMVNRAEGKAQSDRLYRSSVVLQGMTAIPSFAGFAVISPILLPRVFGEQWTGAVPFLMLMAGGGIFRAMVTIERAQQMAAGQIRKIAHTRLVELVISAALIAASAWSGPAALAAIYSLRSLIGYVLVVYSRIGRAAAPALLVRTVGWLVIPTLASIVMIVVVWVATYTLNSDIRVEVRILSGVASGAIVFVGILYGTQRWWKRHLA